MAKTIGIISTLDTTGPEISYVKKEIERRGCRALVIDAGVFTASSVVPEVSAEKSCCGRWSTTGEPCRSARSR
jgi:uncharacterized protein (UPF0261 family)